MKQSEIKYQEAMRKLRERLGIEETGWELIEKLMKETDPRRVRDKTETAPEEAVRINRAIIYGYRQLSPTDKCIYAALCDLAQRNTYWYLREQDLADMLDLSKRTVSRSVNALKRAGLIEARKMLGVNIYIIQPLDKEDKDYKRQRTK